MHRRTMTSQGSSAPAPRPTYVTRTHTWNANFCRDILEVYTKKEVAMEVLDKRTRDRINEAKARARPGG